MTGRALPRAPARGWQADRRDRVGLGERVGEVALGDVGRRGRRARILPAGVARDTERDGRHVVVAAGVVGSPDEPAHTFGERAAATEQVRDREVADEAREPVGAEQHDVAVPYRHDAGVHIELGPRAERARDHRALRMHRRLLVRQTSCALELGHEGVVVRELLQGAVAQQVRARVPDVPEHDPVALVVDENGRDRRAHAGRRRIALRVLEHAAVRLEDRAPQAILARFALDRRQLAERVDREARRELAGTRAAHAVGDDEQGRQIEERVLVRPPHLARVARARVIDDAQGGHSSYLSSVSPTRTSSPTRKRCSATRA